MFAQTMYCLICHRSNGKCLLYFDFTLKFHLTTHVESHHGTMMKCQQLIQAGPMMKYSLKMTKTTKNDTKVAE